MRNPLDIDMQGGGSQYQLLMRNPLDIDMQGGSQSVRILQPGGGGGGGAKGFSPDSQNPPDTSARGCRGTFPGGS